MLKRILAIIFLFSGLISQAQVSAPVSPLNEKQRKALELLNSFDTTSTSAFWSNIAAADLYHNIHANVIRPERIYQGHKTNFCGYSALTVLLCREQPEVYVKHILELYARGETNINNELIRPSASVRAAAGDLQGKGKLVRYPADQLWLMALPDHFKSYMNIDRKYKPGDENKIWAACTLGKFNRMAKTIGSYTVTSKGTDLIRPGVKDLVSYLRAQLEKTEVVLYVNSKYLHPSKFRIFTLRAPTHFIILYDVREEKGTVVFTYWDYGLKTLELMSPKRLKKMTFGIIGLNNP